MTPRAPSLALLALAACSRGGVPRAEPAPAAPAAFDFSRPLAALDMGADEAARRLGSFEWSARVSWSAARGADRAAALEKHQIRQLASGDFRATLDLDPGTWPGAETGREVVHVGGATYARGRYAPFRERPTDRGRDARRFRDESFRLGGDLARLLGPALLAAPQGQATVLSRPARRFALSLQPDAASGRARGQPEKAAPPRAGEEAGSARPRAEAKPTQGNDPGAPPPGPDDPDTAARRELLEGGAPLVLEGDLLLDAETGVPLQVRMKGILGEKADPKVRVEFDLEAQVTAWGGVVGGVAAPKGALPDERKPRGVARALDQAGLRKRAEPGAEEPDDDE